MRTPRPGQFNVLLAPGGYLDTWCRNNGATRSLIQLYRSAFTVEAIYGAASQQLTDPWELYG